jgi:hypothetical protein
LEVSRQLSKFVLLVQGKSKEVLQVVPHVFKNCLRNSMVFLNIIVVCIICCTDSLERELQYYHFPESRHKGGI